MAIIIYVLKKFRSKTYSRPVGPVKPGFLSILVCIFLNKYNDGHSSIHFIQNLMLNSNLKSDIQKKIKVKRLKTKKRSDRVSPSANTNYNIQNDTK
jgi:hypothetical protein